MTAHFNGGYTVNHYIEAAALFLLCNRLLAEGGKLHALCSSHRLSRFVSLLSVLSLDTYFIHVFILEKLRLVTVGSRFTPFSQMLVLSVETIVLSFLFAFAKDKIAKSVSALLRSRKTV